MELFEDPNKRMNEILAYMRHIDGEYDHVVHMQAMPTPRPRATIMKAKATGNQFVNIYHPSEYTKYMKDLVLMFMASKIKPGNYTMLFATMYFPYPASTPQKNLIDGAKHTKKPDWDNCVKGFQDSLEAAGVILADGNIADGAIRKRMTIEKEGFIRFTLI